MPPKPLSPRLGKILRALVATAALSIFASCQQSEIFVLLNPDGSGRVTTKELIATSGVEELKDKKVLEQVAMTTLTELVHFSKGIDVWEKVSYNITANGDIEFEATGLFPDISKLTLASTSEFPTLLDGLKFDKGDKDRPASIQLVSPVLSPPQQAKPERPEADDPSITAELKKTRLVWSGQEVHIRASHKNESAKVTLHFPGEIVTSSNFNKDAKNQVSLVVTSEKLIDTLEKVIVDDQLALDVLNTGAKIIDNHGAPPIKPETFNQLTFGEPKPIRVEYKPTSMMFDYRGAVDTAKNNPNELLAEVVRLAKEAE